MQRILSLALFTATCAAGASIPCGSVTFNGGGGLATLTCPGSPVLPSGAQIDFVRLVGDFDVQPVSSFTGVVQFTVQAASLPFPSALAVQSALGGGPTGAFTGPAALLGVASVNPFSVDVTSMVLPGLSVSGFTTANISVLYSASGPGMFAPPWVLSGFSGAWYDPPLTSGYEYAGTSGTTFTKITLPLGIGAGIAITYGSGFASSLGTFSSGDTVDFVALTGSSLSSFRLQGIQPQVDSADPGAFPLQVFFSSPTGSFTQSALVPEPSSLLLLAGGLGFVAIARRRPER